MSKNKKIVNKIGELLNPFNILGSKEAATPETKKTIVREQTHNGVTWIDIESPTLKELISLTEAYSFHPLHLNACLSRGQLDRFESEEKYLFILLNIPKYGKKESKISTNRICFFLGDGYLITVHKNTQDTLRTIFEEAKMSEEKHVELFKKSSAYLLHQLLNVLTKDLAVIHDTVMKEVDEIEDLVFDVTMSGAYEITLLRQKIVRLKRVTSSFKNIVQDLASDQSNLTNAMGRYFTYLSNDVNKLREQLEEAKEVVEIYKDADFTVSTERTNKILGILTIIFTLGIPATIIGSFYGMNVLVPGGIEAGAWTFFGPYTTFYLVIMAAVAPALLMLWLFKTKKWF